MAYIILKRNCELVLPAGLLYATPALVFYVVTPAVGASRQGQGLLWLQPDAVHFNYRALGALEWCLNFEFCSHCCFSCLSAYAYLMFIKSGKKTTI